MPRCEESKNNSALLMVAVPWECTKRQVSRVCRGQAYRRFEDLGHFNACVKTGSVASCCQQWKKQASSSDHGQHHRRALRLAASPSSGPARLLAALREQRLTDKDLDCLDSASAEAHPDGTGAQKKACKAWASPAAAGTRRST